MDPDPFIWLSWIRIRIGNADPDPEACKNSYFVNLKSDQDPDSDPRWFGIKNQCGSTTQLTAILAKDFHTGIVLDWAPFYADPDTTFYFYVDPDRNPKSKYN